jgi:broad specificity phosphatase PhoE
VSALYLIRHGQAGPRHRYDALSELGQRQAAALGEHLAANKTHFQTVITGGLERQQRTAERVLRAYAQSGEPAPELVVDRRWDEFDLARVFEELGPKLARDDSDFARSYEQMLDEMQDEHAAVHRVHNPCDIAIVTAWVEGRYQYGGESWIEFRSRILEAVDSLEGQEPGRKTAVFTSATPVGIAVAHALGLDEQQLWRLAGVAYNTSITTLRHSRDELRLFSFNGLPHLTDATMWSFR